MPRFTPYYNTLVNIYLVRAVNCYTERQTNDLGRIAKVPDSRVLASTAAMFHANLIVTLFAVLRK